MVISPLLGILALGSPALAGTDPAPGAGSVSAPNTPTVEVAVVGARVAAERAGTHSLHREGESGGVILEYTKDGLRVLHCQGHMFPATQTPARRPQKREK
jgi:hypothetical protein